MIGKSMLHSLLDLALFVPMSLALFEVASNPSTIFLHDPGGPVRFDSGSSTTCHDVVGPFRVTM